MFGERTEQQEEEGAGHSSCREGILSAVTAWDYKKVRRLLKGS